MFAAGQTLERWLHCFSNWSLKGKRERGKEMEREGRAVKVFAKDKPQTSKVDVPSEWTPSGIHSTPCDRGLFVTARKKPDTLCLQLEAPWNALKRVKGPSSYAPLSNVWVKFRRICSLFQFLWTNYRILLTRGFIFMKAKCRRSSVEHDTRWYVILRNSLRYVD